jgi:membrane protein YqaA with SNARE-associated domain
MRNITRWASKSVRSLYDWTLHWAKTKYSNYALFGIAFMGASFFPVPPSVLLIPLVVAEPKNWWKKALICTIGSVCGAFLGYAIGKIFYGTVGIRIVNFYNLQHFIDVIGRKYANNAFLSIFVGSIMPIPYKAMTITAGMFNISLSILTLASILGRSARYFVISAALKFFDAKIQGATGKYFNILFIILLISLVVGFLILKHWAL